MRETDAFRGHSNGTTKLDLWNGESYAFEGSLWHAGFHMRSILPAKSNLRRLRFASILEAVVKAFLTHRIFAASPTSLDLNTARVANTFDLREDRYRSIIRRQNPLSRYKSLYSLQRSATILR